ncbi:hypothetical protein [Devosia sp. SD17-2]|uniref:hypothetical protein n=1 Tax=Devosia sp. SD17-2 TaxID=2976459 RepID=UPI0023D7D763|nr:hypothetical protein [Devosia sp. SD17-2]WEJ33043.1 hypothetical protein NYQ88_19640 [Devosia sp. SD17-2]
MDATPFFKFDLLAYDENDLKELEKFHKASFSIENIKSAASTLKYLRGAIAFIEKQWAEPDEAFVRMVAKDFYEGQLRMPVVESLKPIVRRAFSDLFRQRAKHKIDVAFDGGAEEAIPAVDDKKIETTEEELQGFMIVRAIAAEVAPVSRITLRDAQSYCAILFDDNNRKPIVRLHFNEKMKFVTMFGADKDGARHELDSVEDIYRLAKNIKDVVRTYAN